MRASLMILIQSSPRFRLYQAPVMYRPLCMPRAKWTFHAVPLPRLDAARLAD